MDSHSPQGGMKILINLSSLLICEALGALLAMEPDGYQVVATNDVQGVGDFQPGKIVVDVRTLSQGLAARWPDAKIILIDTGLEEDEIINLLLAYRLDGVIKPDTDLPLFKKALSAIEAGQVWIDNSRIKAILDHVESFAKAPKKESLSRKEQEIVILVSQGCRNKEIAEKLCISEQTVKAHISRIFRKCNVSSRSQLVPLAMKFRLSPV